MQSFKISLSNGANVAGIHNIPPRSASALTHRPLIIGLHGSTYDCHYFDTDNAHTALIASSAFGVPFVSIDRPGYGGTTSFLPVSENSSFPEETGIWLHRYILPALWSEFGVRNSCNCIVLLCHSLGSMGGIVAAATHAQDRESVYPLGGVIISGLADKLLEAMKENPVREPNVPPEYVLFPRDIKDNLMFPPQTVHPAILKHTDRLNCRSPFAEIESLRTQWLPTWRDQWASHVVAPLMFGLAERDCFFEGTEEHVRDCIAAFRNSVRADGSLIRHAPHCLELSYWSQGWYARCFGFAIECSTSYAAAIQ
ncbi:hypothetical protein UA08_05486 [Talaromyces atroroseus]|uniref:AB hydrolase-1 domain-containing protein n=1 Tax=Talaromyces atroroseus TaxID=1441469 RepID=A0A225ATJ4_TALAT|nr:hypothetical protein UA08_05486 [Talaromyces atroroseus]OKL58919.1 hypothetical protein UA08_05486 [Talaromyces atroroseus]